MRVGLDIGSTTIKCVVLNDADEVIFDTYERHGSHITEKAKEILERVHGQLGGRTAYLAISGSAGMGLAESCGVPFVQEVFATRVAAKRLAPSTDVIIELGGEDAKILFLTGGTEVRMNGSCAGGTGAFIDQMATLLKMSPEELNAAAATAKRTYTIASRCGVFAKSDIQPLINQGAAAGDIAASIYGAVVNQTIAGLAQGRAIKGNILYLGGPLTFNSVLRQTFDKTLGVTGLCPDHSLHFVALGAAFYADKQFNLAQVADAVEHNAASGSWASEPPLFASKEEYEAFHARHLKASVPHVPFGADCGPVHIGIDSGSTTVKLAVIDQNANLLFTSYQPNLGNPVPLVKEVLQKLYADHPGLEVASVTTTGYGEALIQHAFNADAGVVETVAHFTAARHFLPEVDFIIDIGGQDMKCFKIEDGAISDIFLNEACSSGCGSFLQTFAEALGYDVKEFAALGLFADRPVDLGSRCTVFMNSSVKQAQKDGASVKDISAGLSISIVKNAIYKVIRAASADDLGQHIVVQGGTFLNDAVLRSFERELGREVTRPTIAGIMGAFGAALAARDLHLERSALLSSQDLEKFTHTAKPATCGLCTNHCSLTVNTFDGGRRFISGNRCSRPLGEEPHHLPDLMRYKYQKLRALHGKGEGDGSRGRIGIPFGLNMYENLPFWFTFFTKLNFEVVLSPESSRKLYLKGQRTIPSDTVCYPAKLLHGHVEALVEAGVDAVWYPCMSYNNDEGIGDNHYNCPVVAYYPELIAANVPSLKQTRFLDPYVGLWRHKDFGKRIAQLMHQEFGIPKKESAAAARAAYEAYEAYVHDVRATGKEYIDYARSHGLNIIVVCGRPYHIDPEINHGINDLITSFGFVLVTEDALSYLEGYAPRKVLNQWTFQSRMYNAARYVCTQPDMQVVQLVSFGCGTDAITTDEMRSILEDGDKLYTQLKIDDISNLGAVKIRIRSLMAAIDARKEN